MVLATGAPDGLECNQTRHEKTGMCLINQTFPEAKVRNHEEEWKERSVSSDRTNLFWNAIEVYKVRERCSSQMIISVLRDIIQKTA